MVKARVILKHAKSYRTVEDGRFIQDVPRIVTGLENVQRYQANGHFSVTVLKGADELKAAVQTVATTKPAKNMEQEDDDDDDEEDEPVFSKQAAKPAAKAASGVALKKKR